MATYTAPEVQQMKDGGNAKFSSKYLAKWNSSSFPAPVDKNPKKVEEFIKQVLVDKVFYSETPVENKQETLKSTAVSSRSLKAQISSRSLKVENSWQAFSEDKPAASAALSTGASTGGNWAEFPSVSAKPATQTVDPFAGQSPIHASPKSVHSTPVDPFATQQKTTWDPFLDTANGIVQPSSTVQTGWSQFETKTEFVANERLAEAPAMSSTPQEAAKPKPTVLDPLPEEWFSVGAAPVHAPTSAPAPQYTYPVQAAGAFQPAHQQPLMHQQPFQPVQQQAHFQPGLHQPYTQQPFSQPSGFGGVYQQGGVSAVPQSSPYGYTAQMPHATLGSFPSFRSAAGVPQQWPQQNQGFPTIQKQDSIASHVSHRVDDASRNPLFQNLDMDMRAKAHSVAGVPIQPPSHGLFQTSATGPTGFNITSTATPFQQSFFQAPPQTGFDEASGNPFA